MELYGWGAHLGSDFTQDQSPTDLAHGINWLELWAIHLALQAFLNMVQDRHVLVRTDNVAAKAHVNHLGDTFSRHLMKEAEILGLWAKKHLRSIWASHISGTANRQADLLSRTTVDHGEWHLHPSIFNDIDSRFGILAVHLFTSNTNSQMDRFFSHFPTPGVEVVDALRSPWPPGLLYAFPLLAVISNVIRKMLDKAAELILITTHWPHCPWFADLVALSVVPPQRLPQDWLILSQGSLLHLDVRWLKLTTWQLSGRSYRAKNFLPGS